MRRTAKLGIGSIILGGVVLTSLPSALAYPRPGVTRQVDPSVGEGSVEGNVVVSAVSGNGRYVAFDSSYPLIPDDVNQMSDIYVRDLVTDSLELISMGFDGTPAVGAPTISRPSHVYANGLSQDPSISSSGRFIAYTSSATNLVVGDTNGLDDVFVYDAKKRVTERVSVDSSGTQGPLQSDAPSISADGRTISFTSLSDTFGEGDDNLYHDVFVHDIRTNRTTLVTRGTNGEAAQSPCPPLLPATPVSPEVKQACIFVEGPLSAISGDARYVTFDSASSNLVADDSNGGTDVFVRDLREGTTERVSVASDGSQAEPWVYSRATERVRSSLAETNGQGAGSTISQDGRFVVFFSNALNLVPNPNGGNPQLPFVAGGAIDQVYLRDLKTNRTTKVSVDSRGAPVFGAQFLYVPTISADGRFVSWNGTMKATGGSGPSGILRHDVASGETRAVSYFTNGNALETGGYSSLSATGRYLTMGSAATAEQDPRHIFWRDLGAIVGGGLLGGQGGPSDGEPEEKFCIVGEVCISTPSTASKPDELDEVASFAAERGLELYGVDVANRIESRDLFVRIQLSDLPSLIDGSGSPLEPNGALYGLRVDVGGRSYEVRAQHTTASKASFGLFRCDGSGPACTETARLEGGYGTTGEEVVFALPWAALELEPGDEFAQVEAYTAVGSYVLGPAKIMDVLRLR